MKKIFLLFTFLILFGFSFGYQQQGFFKYNESNGKISFDCNSPQCIVVLGDLSDNDFVSLDGNVTGAGILGYGFLIGGKQFIQGEAIQVKGNVNLSNQFNFSKLPFYTQIPRNAQVLLLVNGNIKGSDVNVSLSFLSFGEKIRQGWKDFWTMETFKPYTINLLYGPRILGKSANSIFYRIFIVGSLFILILISNKLKKENKIRYIFILLLILRVIYDIRMGLEIDKYYITDYKTYIQKQGYDKIYRDRGDFYSFVNFTKDTLRKHQNYTGDISFYSNNHRPFPGSMKYFLYPHKVIYNKQNKDSKIYVVYGYNGVQIKKNSITIDNKNIITGKVIGFKNNKNAFIFIKEN